MALLRVPIPVQLSPSTYMLLMHLIDLCVDYDPATDGLTFKAGVQAPLDTLYNELIRIKHGAPPPPALLAELRQLQQEGLTEAQEINKNANAQVTLPC